MAWQQGGSVCQPSSRLPAGRDDWERRGNHPLFSMGGSYNHLCTLLLFFLCNINELRVFVFVRLRVNAGSGVLIGHSLSSLLCFCPLETCRGKVFLQEHVPAQSFTSQVFCLPSVVFVRHKHEVLLITTEPLGNDCWWVRVKLTHQRDGWLLTSVCCISSCTVSPTLGCSCPLVDNFTAHSAC